MTKNDRWLEVLKQHRIYNPWGSLCCCGWSPPDPWPITQRGEEDAHMEHIALLMCQAVEAAYDQGFDDAALRMSGHIKKSHAVALRIFDKDVR